MLVIRLRQERITKRTIRFEEITEGELDEPRLGLIYIPKSTLREIGWQPGHELLATFEPGEEEE